MSDENLQQIHDELAEEDKRMDCIKRPLTDGQDRAKADAAARACYAEARNGYRDSKECEAMP